MIQVFKRKAKPVVKNLNVDFRFVAIERDQFDELIENLIVLREENEFYKKEFEKKKSQGKKAVQRHRQKKKKLKTAPKLPLKKSAQVK